MKPALPLAALIVAGLIAPAVAQNECTSMQVFLGVAPQNRANVMSYIAPKLKEKHGVELIAEEIGSGNMLERIGAQGGAPRLSIAHWDVPIGVEACARDLCEPIDASKIPNLAQLDPKSVIKDGQGRIVLLSPEVVGIGLVYNEEMFKKNNLPPPTSWADLKRPELKGRISVTAPASTFGTAALVMYAKMNGGGEGNIDPGFAFVQSLMPNMNSVHTWSSELSNLLQLGEVWLAATGSTMALALQAKGLPIKWIAPKEGAPTVNSGLSLVRGGPCREVAHDYVNLWLSDDFQVMRSVDGGLASAVQTVWPKLPESVRANSPITPANYGTLLPLDWAEISKVRQDWIKRWQRDIR